MGRTGRTRRTRRTGRTGRSGRSGRTGGMLRSVRRSGLARRRGPGPGGVRILRVRLLALARGCASPHVPCGVLSLLVAHAAYPLCHASLPRVPRACGPPRGRPKDECSPGRSDPSRGRNTSRRK
nr:hypothetical protein RVX_2069 [Nitratidesulfovibrio sp. HK-II]